MGQAQSSLVIFAAERPLFLREYATKHYSILPYFVSHLTTEAFQCFVAIMAQSLILYYMIGLEQTFFEFFSVCFTLSMATTAVAVCLGSVFSDPKVTASMFTLVIVPQCYFSGVFIPINLIPSWIRWAQWLCSLTYASRLSMIYEFGGCAEAGLQTCNAILTSNGVDTDRPGVYWAALVALFVAFRVAAMMTLHYKGLNFE